jgi:hydroxymethylbilane synthase
VIATSSLRRRAQLLKSRPDLRIVDIRGNLDTRLAKLDARPEWSGVVLATAGLVRLGLEERIGERLPPDIMLPAPGQGALAVTVRVDDTEVQSGVHAAVHDTAASVEVAAERAFLRRLEGGCQVPIAAYAQLEGTSSGSRLRLRGRVISLGGERAVEGREASLASSEAAAHALGTILAERLLGEGAAAILAEIRQTAAPVVTEP